jgi:hypothetical protein
MKFKIDTLDIPKSKDGNFKIVLNLDCPMIFSLLSYEQLKQTVYQLFTNISEVYIQEKEATPINKNEFLLKENIDHPSHYGGEHDPYETVKVIEAWYGLEGLKYFCLGSNLKYLTRAGKKEGNSEQQDLEKAQWYIDYYNKRLRENEKLNF